MPRNSGVSKVRATAPCSNRGVDIPSGAAGSTIFRLSHRITRSLLRYEHMFEPRRAGPRKVIGIMAGLDRPAEGPREARMRAVARLRQIEDGRWAGRLL